MFILLRTVVHHFSKGSRSSAMHDTDFRKMGKERIIQVLIQLRKGIRRHLADQVDFRRNPHSLRFSDAGRSSLIPNRLLLLLMLNKLDFFRGNLGTKNSRTHGKESALVR